MALGKALGAGVPIGAALFSERVAAAATPGDHGSTYGGNLLACRAALVFLDELIDRGLLASRRKRRARTSRAGCAQSPRASPPSSRCAAPALMWGLELDRPAAPVVQAALEQRLLVNRTSDTVVRLLPPYVITRAEIDEALPLLEAAIATAVEAPGS